MTRAEDDVMFRRDGSEKVEPRSVACRVFPLLRGKLVGGLAWPVLWNAES
jgi:hypothetical protein